MNGVKLSCVRKVRKISDSGCRRPEGVGNPGSRGRESISNSPCGSRKEKRIREAEGEAEAILKVQQAAADGIRFIKEAGADDAVLKIKSLEAFEKAADGKANQDHYPSEIQGLAGMLASAKEVLNG